MKRFFAFLLAVLMLATMLCGCGSDPTPANSDNDTPVSTPDDGEVGGKNESTGNAVVITGLPATYEIAATDPHYIIATPDWRA